MSRFTPLVTVLVVVVLLGFASPVLARQDAEQPSGAGGLGNTRADLDLAYGAVEGTNVHSNGDYATASVSYADAWVIYLVADGTTPSSDDRAFIITRYADAFDSWSYPEAIAVANQLLPADVVPTSDMAPYTQPDTGVFKAGTVFDHRQSFYSESIARLFPNRDLYRGGEPGTVWLVLTLDFGSAGPDDHFIGVEARLEEP